MEFLADIDWRERIVLREMLEYQSKNQWKSIMWSKLQKIVEKKEIPKRTFSRVMKSLVKKNVVKWKHIEGEKKNARASCSASCEK